MIKLDLGARTVLDVLSRLEGVERSRGFRFVQPDESDHLVPFADLLERARQRGRRMLAAGVRPGDRVALIIPGAEEFVLCFLGAVSVGLVPVPLYPPMAMSRLDAYVEHTVRILTVSGSKLLVSTRQVEKVLWSMVPRVPTLLDLVTVERLDALAPADLPALDTRPEDPLFLQFTSGSTAEPKGVIVTHGSLLANARGIIYEGLDSQDDDVGVSWLPLYHDMGLIGFVLAPLLAAIPVVFIPTLQFVRRPSLWLEMMHKHRGTMTFAPNFAFARVTKRATEADIARWKLGHVKVVGCGAEPIHPDTMRAFVARFAPTGLRPEALLPCYGMAEATLAMSFVSLDEPILVDAIDSDACYEERRARPTEGRDGAVELVACGRPFAGHDLGVFHPDSGAEARRLGEREIGEIWFRGPSVAAGYHENPDATAHSFRQDGWLRTGDLGYLADGQIYISGRQKDLLIVNGRNYHPQAIEWLAEEVEGVRKGNVVAFSVPSADSEEVVIVAETAEKDIALRAQIGERVRIHVGGAMSLPIREVVLLGLGELPKTTSGKLQRRKTREQYLAAALGQDGVRTMGSGAETFTLARHLVKGLAGRVTHKATALLDAWSSRRKEWDPRRSKSKSPTTSTTSSSDSGSTSG